MQDSIVRTLISCMLVAQLLASQQTQNAKTVIPSKVATLITLSKTIGTIAIGTTLALAAHVTSDVFCILAHEHGHATAHRLCCYLRSIEDEGSIHLIATDNPLFPFGGAFAANFNGHNAWERFFSIISGPIAGILASYSSAVLINCFDETKRDVLLSPINVYSMIANEITTVIAKKSDYPTPTVAKTFITVFTLLKSIRMLSEFQYGLTPFSTKLDGIDGDGIQLWQQLGVTKNISVSFDTLAAIAQLPLAISVGYGLCRGLYNLVRH